MWSVYSNTTWWRLKDGTIKRYKTTQRRWVKWRRGPLKKSAEKQSIYSTRFGFLDLYSDKEKKALICPSGYNIGQCFGAMAKLWNGYHRAHYQEKLDQMIKYAKAIQGV